MRHITKCKIKVEPKSIESCLERDLGLKVKIKKTKKELIKESYKVVIQEGKFLIEL